MDLCEFIDNKCFNNKKCSPISNHKLQNNCSLKKHISEHKYKNYVNFYEFIDNKCFNNKNVFTAIRVVWVSGGSGQEPQNGQFMAF